MLQVRLRNLLLLWPDPVVDARIYVNPPGGPYPQPGNKNIYHQTSNSLGGAVINLAGLLPGNHRLLIIPKNASFDPVGTATAVGVDATRIFRDLKIRFTVDGQGSVTNASVHPDTKDNGTVAIQGGATKNPVLDVRLRPTWIKSP